MSASLVYLLLRQILQMLTQLARDGGAKDETGRSRRRQGVCPGRRCRLARTRPSVST